MSNISHSGDDYFCHECGHAWKRRWVRLWWPIHVHCGRKPKSRTFAGVDTWGSEIGHMGLEVHVLRTAVAVWFWRWRLNVYFGPDEYQGLIEWSVKWQRWYPRSAHLPESER